MCALHLFSPVDTSLGRSELFYIALASAALIGFGWQGVFSSHKVYPTFGTSGFLPGVLILKGV